MCYLLLFVFNHKTSLKFVIGPAKTGHVGTNYTPSHYRSYLSIGTEYLHSVTCHHKPIKCLQRVENGIVIAKWYKKL